MKVKKTVDLKVQVNFDYDLPRQEFSLYISGSTGSYWITTPVVIVDIRASSCLIADIYKVLTQEFLRNIEKNYETDKSELFAEITMQVNRLIEEKL